MFINDVDDVRENARWTTEETGILVQAPRFVKRFDGGHQDAEYSCPFTPFLVGHLFTSKKVVIMYSIGHILLGC